MFVTDNLMLLLLLHINFGAALLSEKTWYKRKQLFKWLIYES